MADLLGRLPGDAISQPDQINDTNVKSLHLEWMFQTDAPGAFETMPLVVDGVMYITTPDTAVVASMPARGGNYGVTIPHPEGFEVLLWWAESRVSDSRK